MPDNTIFIRNKDNATLAAGVSISNGSGGAPTLTQDLAYPMSNLLNSSRYSVWATGPSPPDPTIVHMTVPNSNVVAWGFLGLRGAIVPGFVELAYRSASAGYSTNPGDYTPLSTLSGSGAIDKVFRHASTPMRYLQFKFSFVPSSGWAMGKFLVAKAKDDWFFDTPDAGALYSPGSSRVIIAPQVRVASQAGEPHVTAVGAYAYRRFSLRFANVGDVTRAFVESFAQETKPATYLAGDGTAVEVLPVPDSVKVEHVWLNRWTCSVEMESLP